MRDFLNKISISSSNSSKYGFNSKVFEKYTVDDLLRTDSEPSPYSYTEIKSYRVVQDPTLSSNTVSMSDFQSPSNYTPIEARMSNGWKNHQPSRTKLNVTDSSEKYTQHKKCEMLPVFLREAPLTRTKLVEEEDKTQSKDSD